jgi:hypothetical protein
MLLTALIVFGGAQALTRVAAPSSGPAGASPSVAGENIIAYDVDRLLGFGTVRCWRFEANTGSSDNPTTGSRSQRRSGWPGNVGS